MARTSKPPVDQSLYAAALEGLLIQKQRVEDQIRQVRELMGKRRGRPPGAVSAAATSAVEKAPRKARHLSEAARKRIAAAQKKRWADYRKQQTAGE